MLKTVPSKYGKPGDVMLRTPIGVLSTPILDKPDTRIDPRGQWSCGLQLDPEDMQAIERAMIATFARVFPAMKGSVITPIRPNRAGELHLYAKTTRKPVLVGLDGDPISTINAGMPVRLRVRLCPWVREGRQGVSVYLNTVERVADTAADAANTRILPMAERVFPPKAVPSSTRTASRGY